MIFLDWATDKWNVQDFEPIPDSVDAIEALEAKLSKIHGEGHLGSTAGFPRV